MKLVWLTWWHHREMTPYDWEIECPELRLPPEGHVYRVVPAFKVSWPAEHHY